MFYSYETGCGLLLGLAGAPAVFPQGLAYVKANYTCQQLVRGELMRGRFRRSYEKPEPCTPGKMEKVEYVLPDICHIFRKGHRIMVQIESSWFPLADRNPQKFVDIYTAKADDFQKAAERVYRSRTAPSSLQVEILSQ